MSIFECSSHIFHASFETFSNTLLAELALDRRLLEALGLAAELHALDHAAMVPGSLARLRWGARAEAAAACDRPARAPLRTGQTTTGAIGFDVGTEGSSACWRLLLRLPSGTSYVRTTMHSLSRPKKP